MIRAVLFDVGGPLDMETAFEAAIDADIRAGLEREGFRFDEATWKAAHEAAVDAFAPSLYRALIWRLTQRDAAVCERLHSWMEGRAHARRDLFESRPGIAEVLEVLQARQLKLAIVANQPAETLEKLERHGLATYLESKGISGVYGLRKPDVRLFLRVCDDLGVAPADCVMVGDRIDNDVVPAKLLGMRTVLLRTGRHINQQPRSWDEIPDAEVHDSAGIFSALIAMLESDGRRP